MPSVRQILKGPTPDQTTAEPRQGLEALASQTAPTTGLQDHEDLTVAKLGPSPAESIAERLRFAANQKAALAQNEINRLQQHIDQLKERMDELTRQNLPAGAIHADLDEAHHRLDEARADLSRAHEARQNTDLAASLSQTHQEGHAQHHHEGHGTGAAASVRTALGRTAGGGSPKLVGGRGLKH